MSSNSKITPWMGNVPPLKDTMNDIQWKNHPRNWRWLTDAARADAYWNLPEPQDEAADDRDGKEWDE
jgi:hypothetical protein